MWSRRSARSAAAGVTLAGQFLALQLAVLLLVARSSTSVVSVRQSDADFRETRGARLRAGAENLANIAAVRSVAPDGRTDPARRWRFVRRAAAAGLAAPAPSTSPGPTAPIVAGDRPDAGSATGSTSATSDVQDGAVLDRRRRRRRSTARSPPMSPIIARRRRRLVGIAMVAEAYPSLGSGCSRPLPTCCRSSALGPGARASPARGCSPG